MGRAQAELIGKNYWEEYPSDSDLHREQQSPPRHGRSDQRRV